MRHDDAVRVGCRRSEIFRSVVTTMQHFTVVRPNHCDRLSILP